MQANQFNFASKSQAFASATVLISQQKLYWKRFFKSKSVIVALFALLTLLLLLVLNYFLSPYQSDKAIYDSSLAYNLPPLNNPVISRTVENGPDTDYLMNLNKKGIIDFESITNYKSFYIIKYNPYQVLSFLSPKDGLKTYFGTNSVGIDNFTLMTDSILITLLITFVSGLIHLFFGSLIGSLVGFYSNKALYKSSYFILSAVIVVPYLFLTISLFLLFGYSLAKAICFLSIVGFFSIFYTSYHKCQEIKILSYIDGYKTIGYSDSRIILRVIFKQIVFYNLSFFSDQLSLSFLSLAALSFFNVENINSHINIGNLYKQIIEDFSNYYLSISTIVISIALIVIFKIIGASLNMALYPKI